MQILIVQGPPVLIICSWMAATTIRRRATTEEDCSKYNSRAWYRGSVDGRADGGGVSTYLFVNNNYCYTNHLLIPMSSLSPSFVASRHVVECSSFPAIRGQWINSREQTLLVTGSSTRQTKLHSTYSYLNMPQPCYLGTGFPSLLRLWKALHIGLKAGGDDNTTTAAANIFCCYCASAGGGEDGVLVVASSSLWF